MVASSAERTTCSKQRGSFTARRQPDGDWIIRNADGEPIN
jgi:hypothetical protein